MPAASGPYTRRRPPLRAAVARGACAAGFALLTAPPAAAQPALDLAALQEQAVRWLQDYIRVNTANPPGNEILGARFLASVLEAEGVPYEIIESAPGRGNLVARLAGGAEPALVLLHHMDVVPADARHWSTDPFSGELRDGHIYGRGALDNKTGGILQLAGFLALHRAGVPLRRDVIYVATADEEAGGFHGAGWLVEHRPDIFRGAGYLLNEGGGGIGVDGRVQFGIEVTQKVPYWLRLTASGEPGHGSRPRAASAVTTLIEALERLRLHAFEPRIVPAVGAMFRGMAANAPPPWDERLAEIEAAKRRPGVLRELQAFDPGLHGLTRNTCSITRLEASDKINVVPPEAAAEIDCRLLPDQDPAAFLAELGAVLGPAIAIETLMGFTPAISPTENALYHTLEAVARTHFPDATVAPSVLGGFTDSHFFRDRGIASYGFEPTVIPRQDLDRVHGNDERVSVENVRRGVTLMVDILGRFAAARPVL